MNLKCILFDADGVVITGERFSDVYQREHNVKQEELTPFFSGPFKQCRIGKADLITELIPWLKKWKWQQTPEEFLEYWFSQSKVDSELITLIQKLRKQGIICALASNQERRRGEYLKTELNCQNYFDHCYFSGELGLQKPNAAFFNAILKDIKEKYNITAQEILFFDDEPRNGDAAEKCGIKSIVLRSVSDAKEAIGEILSKTS